MKLLVVDDSHFIRNRISRAVAVHRIDSVITAPNGMEALRLFQKESPDLVTMDITMPGLDGIACTSAMVRLNPKVLILVVSAVADKATAIRALKQGANGFLLKPFSDDEINDSLTELLRGAGHG
ncbi:MAG: response regulator [Xanthomonadales bacterium]|nr:response regulator [Xanthomonadales bacterium]